MSETGNTLNPWEKPRIKCIHHTKDSPAKVEEKFLSLEKRSYIKRKTMKTQDSPAKAEEHIPVFKDCQTWPTNSKKTNLNKSIGHLQQVQKHSRFHQSPG